MRIYSLFDLKMKEYGNLVLGQNDEVIVRAMRDGIAGSGSSVDKYPDDFELHYLGTFNPETGAVTVVMTPELVAKVGDVLRGPIPQAGGER